MAIIQSAANPNVLQTVDPTFLAARVATYPSELLGSYSVGARTGALPASLIAAAANTCLWSFKYNGPGVCVIRRLAIYVQCNAAYTQGGVRIAAYQSRGAYTQGTVNATRANAYAQNGARRTSMPTATVDIYACTTAHITGDSGTFDTNPFGTFLCDLPAQIAVIPRFGMGVLYESQSTNLHPIVLASTEGIKIINETAFAATGNANMGVIIEWDEMTSY